MPQTDPQPRVSDENLLINELIRDYLSYNAYKHTLGVFLSGGLALLPRSPLPSPCARCGCRLLLCRWHGTP